MAKIQNRAPCEPSELTIAAFPVNHWGHRVGRRRKERGYNGYLISGHGRRIVFVGDTAHMLDFSRQVPHHTEGEGSPERDPQARGEAVDLCVMPIGCYTMSHNHASPEETWDMFHQVQGRYLLAHHWRTFMLGPEPDFEPMERLLAASGPDSHRIVCKEPGGTFVLPAVPVPASAKAEPAF